MTKTKAKGINWKPFTDYLSRPFAFAVVGILYLLISIFIIGFTRPEFSYGILYAIGFFAVAIVMAAKKVGFLAGLMAALIPCFATFVSLGGFDATAGMWIGFIGAVILLANEYGIVEWQKRTIGVKYLLFAPLIFWLVWSISYFYGRFTLGMELPLATILNHAGIAILSLDGILYLTGILKDKHQWLKWIGLILTIAGALWLTLILGWGLQLVH